MELRKKFFMVFSPLLFGRVLAFSFCIGPCKPYPALFLDFAAHGDGTSDQVTGSALVSDRLVWFWSGADGGVICTVENQFCS